MAVQVSFPGVYIDEFAPGAPIEGVGTSTAAFIGPTSAGDLDTPTKVTSWDRFRQLFGDQPLPGFFLWYAVRGFFQNGGQVCYIVRASNGTYAGLGIGNPPAAPPLDNRGGNAMLRVRARQPGIPAPAIGVEVIGRNRLQAANTSVYQPAGNFTVTALREVQLTNAAEAAQFRPTDWVNLGAADPRVRVVRVTNDRLRFATDLATPIANNGPIRLADAPAGTQSIRILSGVAVPDGALVQGTMLTIVQGASTQSQTAEIVEAEPLLTGPPITTYRVTFRQGLTAPISLDPVNPATVQSEEFDFQVSQGAATTIYNNLSVDSAHPRYFLRIINVPNGLVQVEQIEPPPTDAPPNSLPVNTGGAVALAGGANENLATLGAVDYTDALDTLREIDDVNIVAIPDGSVIPAAATVQQAIIAHCELLQDRFGVLDSQPGLPLFGVGANPGIDTQRRSVDSTRGYAALYYPWLRVSPVGPGDPILVPPSGHVCGIMARVDANRGVFKAPANENVNGAIGVETTMTDIDQGQLNLSGINVVRVFQGGGRPILWGARTTATDRNWQYVNIRRLFLFLEESIQEGIRWAVFEPNNTSLWQKLKRTISAFLLQQWRDGALFGLTPEEAFYVRIDETLNPDSQRALGRLYIEIGVRPSYPAEFIIVRIGIWQGGSETTET
ncbi:MAG: phage tail sheath subtilisin-like domain-containing protein [Acidobacteriota bacterium]|nr:phage tail sheath subtilisin-like domain-containing protein [Acidobacteriota bacterium]